MVKILMKCPFCQTKTKKMTQFIQETFVCHNCPHEVRLITNDIGASPVICIFVKYNDQKYVLNWNPGGGKFIVYLPDSKEGEEIFDVIITADNYMPDVINPNNALQKLKTILTFS